MNQSSGATGVTGPATCDVTGDEQRTTDDDGFRRPYRDSRGSALDPCIIENPLFAMEEGAGGGDRRSPRPWTSTDLYQVKRPLPEGEEQPGYAGKQNLGVGEQCSVRVTSRDDRFIPCEVRPMKRCHSAPEGHVNLRDPTAQRRTRLLHQASRVDMVKSYMRQATKHYFGLDETDDERNRVRWRERRRRLACRAYGRLKPECCQEASYEPPAYRRRSLSDLLDVPDWAETAPAAPCRRKEHVARLTWRGIGYLSQWVAHGRPGGTSQRTRSRSFPRAPPPAQPRSPPRYSPAEEGLPVEGCGESPYSLPTPPVADEVFFDKVPPHSSGAPDDLRVDHLREKPFSNRFVRTGSSSGADVVDSGGPSVGHRRIWGRLLDRLFDNSNRRQYGRGVVAKLFGGHTWRRSVASRADVASQLNDLEDHRPYFTYWVTTVQILIMAISLGCYGFGPFGFELQQISGKVMDTSLSLQQVDYWEPPNLWLGPRAADLIHLGAKFAPCMRRDARLDAEIQAERSRERHTACCIRNDRSGCVQAPRTGCSSTISTWHQWSEGRGHSPEGRISGPVCGQDPHYCSEPASRAPHEWPDDITKWPICRRPSPAPEGSLSAEHMTCEVVGHPCCVGIHGHCEITTREYCSFVNGYFHEEAALCSQVSCLDDVCGMIPFYDPEKPDQFYRLWTALFLHAGIFHLVLTVVIQFFFLRDLEKMAGASRVAIIYIVSGMAGNLASSIFVPYRAEVGPAGSQFGLLACHFVEVINVWPMLQRPWRALLRLVALTVVLFAVGLLPWIDNYAHIFGFIVGFLLSYALLPYVSFGPYDRARKKVLIAVCVTTVTLLVLFLLVLFYVTPFYDCEWCEYLNCLPLTRDFCAEQNINFDRRPRL